MLGATGIVPGEVWRSGRRSRRRREGRCFERRLAMGGENTSLAAPGAMGQGVGSGRSRIHAIHAPRIARAVHAAVRIQFPATSEAMVEPS